MVRLAARVRSEWGVGLPIQNGNDAIPFPVNFAPSYPV